MITFRLDDPNLVENFEAAKALKKIGFEDEETQKLYDEQLRRDATTPTPPHGRSC